MKKINFIFILSLSCILINAQTPEQQINDRMTYVFAQLNKNNIPTGILSNYGIQPIELAYYNGVPADSNYVEINSFKQLFAGLYSAKINDAISMTSPVVFAKQLDDYTHIDATPVYLMHYNYNRIKENAVQQGLVNVVNDQIIETGAGSPYETLQLFAAAPKEVIFNSGIVRFVFPSALWKTNVTKTVSSIQVKFDEQSSYVTTNWNTPISKQYTSNGIKKVYFKLNYTDGSSVVSQTNIIVRNAIQIIPPPYRVGSPGEAPGVAGAQFDVTIAGTAEHSGGTLQVKLAPTNATGKIQKALIVVEGFDMSPNLGQPNMDLSDFLNENSIVGSINGAYPKIYQELQNEGYDIVYVDNAEGMDDIRRNAALFRDALNWVNNPNNKIGYYPNVVMGISMGGLVARYALRKMEIDGQDHHTWKYITIDTPHKGANLPVGLQAMTRHLTSIDLQYRGVPVFSVSFL